MRAEDPVVGVDYAAGEVVLTFKPESMPSQYEVVAAPPSIGVSAIDSVFEALQSVRLVKLVPTYDELNSVVERRFLLVYGSGADPALVAAEVAELPGFASVTVNPLWRFELHGTKRFVPSNQTTRFSEQWNLDNTDQPDLSDIDAPEAWAIEEGDPGVVVGIFDSGIMFDRCVAGWRLHSDFNHYFIPAEDSTSPGALTEADLNGQDDDNDGFVDNVIGTNVAGSCPPGVCVNQTPAASWRAIPLDWEIAVPLPGENCPPEPTSWDVIETNDHGTSVGSIAVGKLDGLKQSTPGGSVNHKDIVGIAHGCKVYDVRFGCPLGDFEAAQALYMLARKCRVINMSFGRPDTTLLTGGDTRFGEAVQKVTRLPQYDCVLVASTGNGGRGTVVHYPAKYDSVLAVGAMARNIGGIPSRSNHSNFSNTEKLVDLLAPVDLTPSGDEGVLCDGHSSVATPPFPCSVFGPSASPVEEVANFGGTSAAAPQVAGVAALVRSRFPSLNQFQVKQRLKRSAEYYWSSQMPRPSYEHGYGKVNAYRALTEWGSIVTSTTWVSTDTRDGKYYASGDLTIEPGVTLTIGPGVVVKVAPDHEKSGDDPDRVQIIVKGSLVVQGTAENPVVFESFTDSAPTETDWVGIHFDAGSSGTITHAVIKNASHAIENYAPITLADCTIDSCDVGIDAHANIALSNTLVAENVGQTAAVDLYGGSTTFVKCTFADNSGAAVAVRGGSSASFDRCVVAFNGGPAVRVMSGWTGTASMESSVLFGNTSVSGSLSDSDWVTAGQDVLNLNPAFCDAAGGDYQLYAFSPAAAGPHFTERIGARDIGCVPGADVTVSTSGLPPSFNPSVVPACPEDDAPKLVVTVDLNEAVMTRDVGPSELTLDIADFSSKIFDSDAVLSAGGSATSPDYTTTITHGGFGRYGVDDVDVLLNGVPLGPKAHVDIRTPDTHATYGEVQINDLAFFLANYPSGTYPYLWYLDYNGLGSVDIVDFTWFVAHYQHASPYSPINGPAEAAQSIAHVAFEFTEEYVTALSRCLYADVNLEDIGGVRVCAISVRSNRDDLTFAEWRPGDGAIGKVLFTPVVRDGENELFFGILADDSFTGTSSHLGRLVFDVSGNEPIEIGEGQFILTVGDIQIGSGPAAYTAQMSGALGRTLDPSIQTVFHNRLEQNFPNPFNPATTIAFSISKASHVSVVIYDVAGRRVRDLVNEQRNRGAYRVPWDGRDDRGTQVASGVYFYKLVAGRFTDTKKMTILK